MSKPVTDLPLFLSPKPNYCPVVLHLLHALTVQA